MATVRVCVCGDQGVGKTSIITRQIKDVFVEGRLCSKLPNISIPTRSTDLHARAMGLRSLPDGSDAALDSTLLVADTSALPTDRDALKMELRKANVILLVYSDHYSYERVGLFWMPFFRTLGLNVPVVLCASKSDMAPTSTDGGQSVADEMLAVMSEFKEIDSCVRTSAKHHSNVSEAFFLCQRAVTHPIAPLFDTKEAVMKPAAITALQRIFYLCDGDQDGRWNDEEIRKFQSKCFNFILSNEEVDEIKSCIQKLDPSAVDDHGIKESGFLLLNRIYIDRGRHETIWEILRKFHYTDSLSLKDSFLHPTLNAPPFSSTELSPLGYRFFADLFLLHDKDNDGGLNNNELAALFAPSSGPPAAWATDDFASSTVRDEAGHVTLQGWLALWSMTTLESASTTLEYLALLGFEHASGSAAAAIGVTRARARDRRRHRVRAASRIERSVLLCYVVGAAGAGKTALLDAFLGRALGAGYYAPTIHPRSAVNAVELAGGKQCYLILKELGELEPAILENQRKLDACDLVCYAYDSGDPDSFAEVAGLHARYPALNDVPGVFVALKADLDKAVQRADVQPDELAESLKVAPPVHVSVKWSSISELFTHLAECAINPSQSIPHNSDEPPDRSAMYLSAGVAAISVAAGMIVWKKVATNP